jgi:hypothetical protein
MHQGMASGTQADQVLFGIPTTGVTLYLQNTAALQEIHGDFY